MIKYEKELPIGFHTWIEFYDSFRNNFNDDTSNFITFEYCGGNGLDLEIIKLHWEVSYVKEKVLEEFMNNRLDKIEVMDTFQMIHSMMRYVPDEIHTKVNDMRTALILTAKR